jgi:hypothetical protein
MIPTPSANIGRNAAMREITFTLAGYLAAIFILAIVVRF